MQSDAGARRRGLIQAAWILAVVAVATVPRLVALPQVFTPAGVRFVPDGDPYYHVLRAREIAIEHRVTWRDGGLNHPVGADVPWPPLFDVLLAAPAWIAGGTTPTEVQVDTAAAIVPVVLGLLLVLAGAVLARDLLGDSGAVATALVLALSPSAFTYSEVGRPDQHVLEALLLACMLVVYVRSLRGSRAVAGWRGPLALGVLLCAAFWTWPGSALHVGVLCALVSAARLFCDPADRAASRVARLVGAGASLAAVLTAITIALFGPPGALRRVAIVGISAFPVAVSAAAAVWCTAVAAIARMAPGASRMRRAVELASLAAGIGAIALLVPGVREAVAHGLRAAGRGSGWYATISEFRPLFFYPYESIPDQLRDVALRFGLLPILALGGVIELRSGWRSDPARRAEHVFAATIGVVFTALVAHMSRFTYYAALPLALFAAMGLRAVARSWSGSRPLAGLALASVVAGVALAPGVAGVALSGWSRPRWAAIERVVAPVRRSAQDGAVLASWDAGHHVRFFSGHPVVASPFGTDCGEDSMEDVSRFFLADDPDAAAGLLDRRRVRWILVEQVPAAVLAAAAMENAQPAPVTVRGDWLHGYGIHCEPSFDRLVAARLYYQSGMATRDNPEALGRFRLVADVGSGQPAARLFELVRGIAVEVRGARAGRRVVAETHLSTSLGRFTWVASTIAGADGGAELRLPFATGWNGEVLASPYVVGDGVEAHPLVASEDEVQHGAHVSIDLSPAVARRHPGEGR
jgi:dolichyl-diphosphooligosaccharide--protein glycosyltransferase